MTRKEVFETISIEVAISLNLDEEDITPSSTLQGDFGAESIDLMDIIFRLERAFNIKIPRGELFPEPFFQQDSEFVDSTSEQLTPKGVEELRERLPFADLTQFEKEPKLLGISDLFTVDMLCKYICSRLGVTE